MIKRQLYSTLKNWKEDQYRKPILLRGARQVGKTCLVETFGHQCFESLISINLELETEYHACFDTLDPKQICSAISTLAQQKIVPGETLLFFDEIQECPEAIRALRYFKERMPELHVIGAGSLLELVLNTADFRMPVGRITSLYLKPLSYSEFIAEINPDALSILETASLRNPPPISIHHYLLKQMKLYLQLGGMPETVATYLRTEDLLEIQKIQTDILSTYEKDFGHYSKHAPVALLQRCFNRIPHLIGQQIKYNKIDPDVRSRELKVILEKLQEAHLIQPVIASTGSGIPLSASMNIKKFKLNFVDVGLVTRACKIESDFVLQNDIMLLNQGALAEQLVGQELTAYAPSFEETELYYWSKDGHSIAEVDYLYTYQQNILPLEVKSGTLGRLKSLRLFQKERNNILGLRVSQLPLKKEDNILSVPLYMISQLNRLIAETLK